jgi:hypothetical protein
MPCKTRSEVSRDLLHRVECHGLKTVRFSGSGFGNDLRIMGSMIHLFRCTLNPVGRRNKKTSKREPTAFRHCYDRPASVAAPKRPHLAIEVTMSGLTETVIKSPIFSTSAAICRVGSAVLIL